jgi:hypothetical protein
MCLMPAGVPAQGAGAGGAATTALATGAGVDDGAGAACVADVVGAGVVDAALCVALLQPTRAIATLTVPAIAAMFRRLINFFISSPCTHS